MKRLDLIKAKVISLLNWHKEGKCVAEPYYRLKQDVLENELPWLIKQIEGKHTDQLNKDALVEYVLDEDNWLEPDTSLPYFTLWHDGNDLGPKTLRELFTESEFELEKRNVQRSNTEEK